VSIENQVKVFVKKFERELLLVSCLYGIDSSSYRFMDNGASCHMIGTHDLFTSWS
jgi:hypothetical protein